MSERIPNNMSDFDSCIFYFSKSFFIPNVISLVLVSALYLRNIGHQAIRPQPIPPKMEIRTSTNPSTEICRICRFGDNEPCSLIDCPCKCTGSIGKVHERCLFYGCDIKTEIGAKSVRINSFGAKIRTPNQDGSSAGSD